MDEANQVGLRLGGFHDRKKIRSLKSGVWGLAGLIVTGLGKINGAVCRICSALLVVLLAAIVVILFGSVFWRYVFNDPISWSEDAALFCMVWMALLGAPVGLRRGGHVAMEMVLDLFPPRVVKGLRALISLVILATAVIVVYYGVPFVKQGFARIIPSMEWLSQGYVYLALPVGFALLIPICLENVFQAFGPARAEPPKE
jgi:TRAP-type C4-dicarboxylate transport system permease small subunit